MPRIGRVSDSVAGVGTLGFQSRGVAGFGERGNGKIDGRRGEISAQPRRAQANLFHLQPFSGGQRLADAANAGAAVHSIDSQRELRHFGSPVCI